MRAREEVERVLARYRYLLRRERVTEARHIGAATVVALQWVLSDPCPTCGRSENDAFAIEGVVPKVAEPATWPPGGKRCEAALARTEGGRDG